MPAKPAGKRSKAAVAAAVDEALAALRRKSTPKDRDNLKRFGIVAEKHFGVSMANVRQIAKPIGRDHELAEALWKTGWYEARMLATLTDEPERVTPAQMERWARDFDNWAICDTACFCLFYRTPHAWTKIETWRHEKGEFRRRASFALLASVAQHDKTSGDAPFLASLEYVERAADDDRNFVKKGVSWALRGVGQRSPVLHAAAVKLARRLAASSNATKRWVGKDALRDLSRPLIAKRLAARQREANLRSK
jgi:3-methyladenine DNA glycosylase AlkD